MYDRKKGEKKRKKRKKRWSALDCLYIIMYVIFVQYIYLWNFKSVSGAFASIQFLAFSFYSGDSMLHVHICGSCAGYDSSLKLVYNTNLNDGFVNVYLLSQ